MNKNLLKRFLVIVPAALLQLVWFYVLWVWLNPWAVQISVVLAAVSFLLVLFIITKRDESSYRTLWLLVILLFPVPGTVLYLVFGNKRTTRPLQRRFKGAPALPAVPAEEAAPVWDALKADDLRVAQTFGYVHAITGASPQFCEGAFYYPLGDDMFPAMLAAMERARAYIFVEYFIVTPGEMWGAVSEVMLRKAAQGVDVRMIYDDMGSLSTFSFEDAQRLRAQGVKCVPFNPFVFIKGTLNYRDHRKMLVVDGEVAFSGGVNLADEYINRLERFGHWKDTGFKLIGAPARSYARMFAEFWNAFAREPVPEELLRLGPCASPGRPDNGFVLSYYDSPLRAQAASNELYIELLSLATGYAWFFTPYLLPGDALLDALTRAARRGVDVRIIMPGVPDKKVVFRMAHGFYPALLEAGVKIYEYTPGFVHAKSVLVDDVLGTMGTVNLDYRSLFLHFENNALFYRAGLLTDLKEDFLATQAQCRAMRLGENVREGFGSWLVNGVLRVFSPLC